MTPHISTLKLHQLRLGEIAGEAAEPLKAHLATCALCQARAGHQQANRAAFESMPEPLALAAVLHPRHEGGTRRWTTGVVSVFALAATILVAVRIGAPIEPPSSLEHPVPRNELHATPILATSRPNLLARDASASPDITRNTPAVVVRYADAVPSPKKPTQVPKSDLSSTRTKGVASPRLEAWVQAGDSARPLYTGESLGAGSRIQLRYDAMGKRFVTLAGRDSNGVVEIYGTLAAGDPGLHSAPFALTLDDSQGEQAFFAIATDLRPDLANLQSLLAQNPVRMDGAVITSLVLRKD